MTVAQLMELLSNLPPDAEVVLAARDGQTFHALRDLGDDDPSEVVLWPDPAPIDGEESEEVPPGTMTH